MDKKKAREVLKALKDKMLGVGILVAPQPSEVVYSNQTEGSIEDWTYEGLLKAAELDMFSPSKGIMEMDDFVREASWMLELYVMDMAGDDRYTSENPDHYGREENPYIYNKRGIELCNRYAMKLDAIGQRVFGKLPESFVVEWE